jgi:8-oxo-dGTP diphosphatase
MGCAEALEKPRTQTPSGLKIVLVAAAALIDKDGRILIAQRPEGKSLAGLWEFPGGKVHDGESPEFALCRELEEELGVEARECCLSPIAFASHSYDDFHLLMPVFVCRMWKGEIHPREGQAVKWVKPADLYDYKMPPADIPLIPQIIDRL